MYKTKIKILKTFIYGIYFYKFKKQINAFLAIKVYN